MSSIDAILEILTQGGIAAIPTETVYGLAADPFQSEAVARVFRLKQRPAHRPLILHVCDIDMAKTLVKEWTPEAEQLAQNFWPGPLTLILEKAADIPYGVTGGLNTVAIRLPAHETARELIRRYQGPLCAPSANVFGHISPTRAKHVQKSFPDLAILASEMACERGIESSIVDLTSQQYLRAGQITFEEVRMHCPMLKKASHHNSPYPGGEEKHYAPRAPIHCLNFEELKKTFEQYRRQHQRLIICSAQPFLDSQAITFRLPTEALPYAAQLYTLLHQIDSLEPDMILWEAPPDDPAFAAIADRLRRASQ